MYPQLLDHGAPLGEGIPSQEDRVWQEGLGMWSPFLGVAWQHPIPSDLQEFAVRVGGCKPLRVCLSRTKLLPQFFTLFCLFMLYGSGKVMWFLWASH